VRKGSSGFTLDQLVKFGVAIAFVALLLFAIDRVVEQIYQQALDSAIS
jgi:hypothetical protein